VEGCKNKNRFNTKGGKHMENILIDGKVAFGFFVVLVFLIALKTEFDCRKENKKSIEKRIIEKLNRNFKYKGQI
jgi:hypothetical protein